MEDRLRKYVDDLFADTAPTKKAVELKEEMIQNLNDKYADLTANGKTQEAAYNIAVAGIGDISGLLAELNDDTETNATGAYFSEEIRRRSAMITSIAVMGYILSVVPLLVMTMIGFRYAANIGVPVLLVTIACATGLLVYNAMTKPRYYRGSKTMVDEFREWQFDTKQRKSLRGAVSAALWTITVSLYFIISFWTHAWSVTWIIFLLGAATEAIINIFFALKK